MRSKWWPLVAITLGNFMLLIDVTIVNSALPEMAHALDASFTSLQWVMDIYALALAALLMAAGSAADLFGRRRVYLLGLAVFALSSLACGLAPDSGVLIAARAVQGAGAAAMFATNTPLLMAGYAGRDRAVAFGVWGGTSGAAVAVGPVLGGLLTEYAEWRWIFLVNLPLTALAVWCTLRTVGESRGAPGARIDIPGAGLFTLTAGALTYGLIRGGEEGWGDTAAVGSLLAAAVGLLAFVLVERGTRQPLLDLALLRRPSFAVLMIAALLLQAAAFPYLTYVGLWLQSVLGLSPVEAGLAVTPMAGMALVVGAAGGRLLERVAPGRALGCGLLLVGAGALAHMALLDAGSDWPVLVAGLMLSGLGVGLAMPVLVNAALGSAPPERAGMASGAVNTFRQLGYALGIAVLGTVFSARVREVVTGTGTAAPGGHGPGTDPDAVADAISGGHAQAVLEHAPAGQARRLADSLVRDSFAAGLDRICLISGVTALVAGVLVLVVVRGRPAAAPGPRPEAEEPAEPRPKAVEAPAG
ncbi:multidrug MFS transporter [Streptomyces albus subsp. albus]|nr:multidrug MFS transporter [Streptomyces albus subsp. albus]